jgi:hypothetical protein
MIGERFFAMRERLSSVVRGIAALAAETRTDLGEHLTPADTGDGLDKPFTFIVCGEVNAGKSTLINGLFGHQLCPAGVLPLTDGVHRYRFGNPPGDHATAPHFEERCRPIGFLRNFNPIDTPGTDSANPERLNALESLWPAADLILFVFPASNPWGAATWDLIARMPPGMLDRAALVIQHADLKEPCDLNVILGHMADLARKRIGRVPPIFPVSAKLACEAKRSGPAVADRLSASGYPALEAHISNAVCQTPGRRETLETWRGRAAKALRLLEDRIEDQNRHINSHHHFIAEIEREIEDIREQFVSRLPRHLANVAEAFENEALWVSRQLHRRLRASTSILRLFTSDRTGPQMESAFVNRLQQTIEAVAEKDGGEVARVCADHWEKLGQRVESAMNTRLDSAVPLADTLAAARKRFVRCLGFAASQGIGNLRVRTRLDRELRKRNAALRSFVITALVLTIAGAACGALDVPWLPPVFCALAAVFLTGSVLVAWITRRSITRDFRQRLRDTCGTFASALHNDYEDALRAVFRDYAASLDNLRTHLAREKLAIEPRLTRWQQLFLTLKAIEQEL